MQSKLGKDFYEWLNRNFEIKKWRPSEKELEFEVYMGKIDGCFGSFKEQEEFLYPLFKKGIEEIQNIKGVAGNAANLGFVKGLQKWYGWSHRAIYGFSVGSTCEKGDTHYNPDKGKWTAKTIEEAKQMAIDFAENAS